MPLGSSKSYSSVPSSSYNGHPSSSHKTSSSYASSSHKTSSSYASSSHKTSSSYASSRPSSSYPSSTHPSSHPASISGSCNTYTAIFDCDSQTWSVTTDGGTGRCDSSLISWTVSTTDKCTYYINVPVGSAAPGPPSGAPGCCPSSSSSQASSSSSTSGDCSGNCFEVGTSYTFVAPADGSITFGQNDDNVSDNDGTWNITVTGGSGAPWTGTINGGDTTIAGPSMVAGQSYTITASGTIDVTDPPGGYNVDPAGAGHPYPVSNSSDFPCQNAAIFSLYAIFNCSAMP